ncbi:LacI family DNA-binding transcriptional regulator [Daejeonella lutea]|uniref:LacI family transcriptional regulator n=1 Tax=Daejeonella lutea TaxID=572036 RepID=A0A1T5BIV5_9SPHI|nr:substrate-binding domain-containing protein [Daejeonella lutea]SKB47252.1 LacI family transcriptional regulator [Daejeonella lutea]
MKKRSSITDIANVLKISPTTVSFILNGKAREKRISVELVEKVEKYIAEVGYKPNSLARSLRTGKTNIIGLMVESISNPFFATIARRIEELAYKNGYKIIYSSTDNNTVRTKELIQMFRERHVDGYIISPPEGIEEDVSSLINAGIPVVFFDRYLTDVAVDSVTIDNFSSSYDAVKHLISTGCRNIGFVTLDSLQTQMQDRLSGYEKAIEEAGLTLHVKEIGFNQSTENIVRHIVTFLKRSVKLDAIFFATNYLGISGLKAIRTLELDVPNDLSVITFDDHELFELHKPSITAIFQPVDEISDKVINILLNKMKSGAKHKKEQNLVLPTELVIRDSTIAATVPMVNND